MSIALPRPKLVTENEVVLSRDDWDRIVEILGDPALASELAEDANDIAAVAATRDEDAAFAARVEGERGMPVEVTIPLEVIEAELEGRPPDQSLARMPRLDAIVSLVQIEREVAT